MMAHLACLLALLGHDSVWDAETGLPKASGDAYPDRILLISVQDSDIKPWDPCDIATEEILARLRKGEEVFFIDAKSRYGKAKVADGRLVFVRGYQD